VQARECISSVDAVTLLSVLPPSYVDRHTASVGEANIESDRTNWAWCSNPKCQKLVRRRGPRRTGTIKPVTITCVRLVHRPTGLPDSIGPRRHGKLLTSFQFNVSFVVPLVAVANGVVYEQKRVINYY